MQQLKDDHTVFSSSDRAQLLDDAFSLVVAGTGYIYIYLFNIITQIKYNIK